jgi:hypothetical protein
LETVTDVIEREPSDGAIILEIEELRGLVALGR